MKVYLCSLLLSMGISLYINAQASTCDCKSDLIYLNQKIKTLPSYKKNKTAYEGAYNTALSKTSYETPYYNCLELLNRLLLSLSDWHMGIIEGVNDSLNTSFVKYPVYTDNLANLSKYLREKHIEDIEGIYHVNSEFSFGLVFEDNSKTYHAVVLKSAAKEWHKGDIVYKLLPLSDGFFKVIGAQYPSKRLISYHERLNQGIFLRAGFKKDTIPKYFIGNPYPDDVFVFKELSPNINYLKVGSFSSQYPFLKEAEDFYSSLKGKLKKPHLILDLRDNGGGGDRNSDILFKQLRTYVKTNRLHLITNARTGSNAEQFAVKLKRYERVTSYGDKSRGALAYEIRPGDYHTLPSSRFLVILPSKVHNKYLPFETKGVAPDYFLDYKTNWISTIKNTIENLN